MKHLVDNAIILAAGASSRFAPLSYERPKALVNVLGEVLIERQIRQLQSAGVHEIHIVTGYKHEQFEYLSTWPGIYLIHNPDYLTKNNHSSIYAAKDLIRNSYICSADNYFLQNPFEKQIDDAYYAAVFVEGKTEEWCLSIDEEDNITAVTIGGRDAWIMMGHVFWTEEFSSKFLSILAEEIAKPETSSKLWEQIYLENIEQLRLKIRRYEGNAIFEFDDLAELQAFDKSYVSNTRSEILQEIARKIHCKESDITVLKPNYQVGKNEAIGFAFSCNNKQYTYDYRSKELRSLL